MVSQPPLRERLRAIVMQRRHTVWTVDSARSVLGSRPDGRPPTQEDIKAALDGLTHDGLLTGSSDGTWSLTAETAEAQHPEHGLVEKLASLEHLAAQLAAGDGYVMLPLRDLAPEADKHLALYDDTALRRITDLLRMAGVKWWPEPLPASATAPILVVDPDRATAQLIAALGAFARDPSPTTAVAALEHARSLDRLVTGQAASNGSGRPAGQRPRQLTRSPQRPALPPGAES